MAKVVEFLKTTAVGGLLVIVPIAIILFVLGQIFYGLYSLSESVLNQLNIEIDDALIMVGIAALSLVGLCFLTGLVVQTRLGDVLKRWFGRNVGRRIPMFNALSSLTKRFAGFDGENFASVEVDLYDSSARMIGFRIENLPENRCAVFIPSAPVATVGNVYVISRDKVTEINASVTDTLASITQWGIDTSDLYAGIPIEGKEKAGTGDDLD